MECLGIPSNSELVHKFQLDYFQYNLFGDGVLSHGGPSLQYHFLIAISSKLKRLKMVIEFKALNIVSKTVHNDTDYYYFCNCEPHNGIVTCQSR